MNSTNNYTPVPYSQVDTWPYLHNIAPPSGIDGGDPDADISEIYEKIQEDLCGQNLSPRVLSAMRGRLAQGPLPSRETTMNTYPPSPQEAPAEFDSAHRAYQKTVLAVEPGRAAGSVVDHSQTGSAYDQQVAELDVLAKLAATKNTQVSGFEDLLDGVSGDAYRVPPSQEVREFAQSQQRQQITGAADRFSGQPLNNLADLERRVGQAEELCKIVLVIMELIRMARNEALASGAPRSDYELPEEYMSK